MAMVMAHLRETSSSGGSMGRPNDPISTADSGKYVRYTTQQVEALERVYSECSKPSSLRRQQLIREYPILANIEPKQIKVWFQNRRCREKQRKEASRLQSVNKKLTAMNKLLMEENDRLQKQVSQLVNENGHMKHHLSSINGSSSNDAICDSAATAPQHSLRDVNNPTGLLSIAEETLQEFLSKATGTAVDWVPMPGMKPGPDVVGIFAISHTYNGIAARACGLVSLEPSKICEILKDRPSWLRDCRSLEVFTMLPAGNGGTIELVYSQMYGPTTMAPARDFWTLRYTTNLENGSLVVCERSLSGTGAGPNPTSASQFVRAEMLPSGYLIRPCDGGGCTIHIVDHFNLQAWSVSEVLRPLYESSKAVAQRITIAALRYVRQVAQESSGEMAYGWGRQPAVLRAFGQRLIRGFNDAVNGFFDDGWSSLHCDEADDVVVTINSSKNLPPNTLIGGVVCVKASMLLQNVSPPVLVRFLKEHRSEWADFNVDAFSAATLKTGGYAFPETPPTRFTGTQTIMPLGQTIEQEILEVVRLEGHSLVVEGAFVSRDIHLLQICNGREEDDGGACCELVFAPIDEMFPDDAPLVSSGFRVIPLDSKAQRDSSQPNRTLDLTSSLDLNRSVLMIAFQFPYANNLHESVAIMACQYIRSVISSVQRVALAISSPSGPSPLTNPKLTSPEAQSLAQWISRSYTFYLGNPLVISEGSALKRLWQLEDAVLCCSVQSPAVFIFANQAGLEMVETTMVSLQDVTLDKIFDESGRKMLFEAFGKLMQNGCACLPGGLCVSTTRRHVSYEQALAWKVHSEDNGVHCLAFMFVNWSFV